MANVGQARLYPGLEVLLQRLVATGTPWAVVTNSVSYYAEALLAHVGAMPPVSICYHDTTMHKPHPAPVLAAISRLRIPTGLQGVGIGDHANDCAAYRAAGLTTAGAGWSPALDRSAPWQTVCSSAEELAARFGF